MQYLGSTYRKNLLFIWNSNFTGCPAFYLQPYRDWVLSLQSMCLCSSVSCLTRSPTTLAKTRKSCIDSNTLLPLHSSWSRAVPRRTSCVWGLPGAGLSQLLLSPTQSSLAEEQPTDRHAWFSSILSSMLAFLISNMAITAFTISTWAHVILESEFYNWKDSWRVFHKWGNWGPHTPLPPKKQ